MFRKNEKRNFLRVPVEWQVDIESEQGVIKLDIINLSLGGLMFRTGEKIELNKELILNLPLGSLPVKVQWHKENIYGASFTNLSGANTAAIVKEVYDRWRNNEIKKQN